MAEKTFKGIVLLNKKQYNEYYESNPVLKDGCPVICVITPEAGVEADSKLMMKVGDGTTAFRSLPWLSGLSADVYDWALQETKPTYTASEIGGLADFVTGEIQNTNAPYIKNFNESAWVLNTSSHSNAEYMMSILETEHNRGEYCVVTAIYEKLSDGSLSNLLSENLKNSSGDITIFSNSPFEGVVYIDRIYPQEPLSNQNLVPISALSEESFNGLSEKDSGTLYLIY